MNYPSKGAHLLIDAGGTKTAFALLHDGKLFRCQGAGINANYTPEADILRILAEATPQFPKEATIRGIDYYGAGCATPPNAIAFGSGYVKIGDMIKGGVWLNLIAVVLITLATFFIAVPVFGLVL